MSATDLTTGKLTVSIYLELPQFGTEDTEWSMATQYQYKPRLFEVYTMRTCTMAQAMKVVAKLRDENPSQKMTAIWDGPTEL